ncbi:MAG: SEC-C metal-binding domain-containing protein, partial [Bacillota bacterium]
ALSDGQASNSDGQPLREKVMQIGLAFLRRELTDLEQFVLIQIFDQSWKDHLYAMDMLRTGIGLQAFAERDPRIAYKKEGYRFFQEMMAGIRDKVTDLIFRARIVGQAQTRSAYNITSARHDQIESYGAGDNARAASKLMGQDEQAQAAAAEGEAGAAVVKPIVRETPKVGRNDPCPCGSGKKYKKCCGANVAS